MSSQLWSAKGAKYIDPFCQATVQPDNKQVYQHTACQRDQKCSAFINISWCKDLPNHQMAPMNCHTYSDKQNLQCTHSKQPVDKHPVFR